MGISTDDIVLLAHILTIIYYVLLGCFMLSRKADENASPAGQANWLHMTRCIAALMFIWAFDWFIYLLPILCDEQSRTYAEGLCFLFTMIMINPLIYAVLKATIQRRPRRNISFALIPAPFVALTIWYVFAPSGTMQKLPVLLAIIYDLLYIVFLVVRYAVECKQYIRLIKSEYSDITGRNVVWAWSCFGGFILQSLAFVLYCIFWTPVLDAVYWVMSMVNIAYLCYCACRQRIVEIHESEESEDAESDTAEQTPKGEEKAFYAVVEQKLKTQCEEKELYLEPDLTRDVLCRNISVSSTYLKMYFRSRDLSFYQYINTLRVEYAVKLMSENPDLPISEVAERSGFRSQTTFRKMFLMVTGHLPSGLRRKNRE